MSIIEIFVLKLKLHINETFEQIRKALNVREKLLLQQIDVRTESYQQNTIRTTNQQQSIFTGEIQFSADNIDIILNEIRIFGNININSINIVENKKPKLVENNETQHELIDIFDKENINLLNKSIISIMVNDTKELIDDHLKKNTNCIPFDDDDRRERNKSSDQFEKVIEKEKKTQFKITTCPAKIQLKNISKVIINTDCKRSCLNKHCEYYDKFLNKINKSLFETRTHQDDMPCRSSSNENISNSGLTSSSAQLSSSSSTSLTSKESNSIDAFSKQSGNDNKNNKDKDISIKCTAEENEHCVHIEKWLQQMLSDSEVELIAK